MCVYVCMYLYVYYNLLINISNKKNILTLQKNDHPVKYLKISEVSTDLFFHIMMHKKSASHLSETDHGIFSVQFPEWDYIYIHCLLIGISSYANLIKKNIKKKKNMHRWIHSIINIMN